MHVYIKNSIIKVGACIGFVYENIAEIKTMSLRNNIDYVQTIPFVDNYPDTLGINKIKSTNEYCWKRWSRTGIYIFEYSYYSK